MAFVFLSQFLIMYQFNLSRKCPLVGEKLKNHGDTEAQSSFKLRHYPIFGLLQLRQFQPAQRFYLQFIFDHRKTFG